MITRETLELAALAAGMTYRDDLWDGGHVQHVDGLWAPWRPHLDDGDAARLAVRLDMEIVPSPHGWHASTTRDGWHDWARVKHDDTEPDKLRAWREAVVLCAAAVGERMRCGR